VNSKQDKRSINLHNHGQYTLPNLGREAGQINRATPPTSYRVTIHNYFW